MRIILNRSIDTEPESMYRELKWFPLSYRHKLKTCILVYKAFNQLTPSYITDLVNLYNPATQMTLRSVKNKVLGVPFTKSKIYERAFTNGPTLYNNLPLHIRDSKSLVSLKSSLYSYYYQSYLSTISSS